MTDTPNNVTLKDVYELVDDKFTSVNKNVDEKFQKVNDKVDVVNIKVANIEGRMVMIPLLISSGLGLFSIIINLVLKK